MIKLGFLASHGGSNVGAIIAACRDGRLKADPTVVISNNSGAFVLERARQMGIPSYHLSSRTYPDAAALDTAITDTLTRHEVDLVILAGYLKRLGPSTIDHWRGCIINTHPSLLPKHGGRGMYGERVHAAVLAAGETVTGISIHLVTERYDEGPILAQIIEPVVPGDTPETLASRLYPREQALSIDVIARISQGELLKMNDAKSKPRHSDSQ